MESETTDNSKVLRSGSFGAVASAYERFRPSPPSPAIDWMLPTGASVVVDLDAGEGEEVVAAEGLDVVG